MRLKAFISSNLDEFGPEEKPDSTRRKIAAVLREFNVDSVMWEDFHGPEGMTPKQFYAQHLQDCQLYIGLFGLEESQPTADEYKESKLLGLERDRKSTRLNSSHSRASRMPSSA